MLPMKPAPDQIEAATVGQDVLSRPIIIVGAPRSGTTLLAGLIAAHRQVAFFEEPRLIWKYGHDRKSDMLRPADATPRVVRHIRGAFAARVRAAGKMRMAEKTPSNALRLGFIDRIFPDARFVHIIRHGLDSVLSIRSYWAGYASGMGGKSPVRLRQRLAELNLLRLAYYGPEVLRRLFPRLAGTVLGPNVWGPRIPGIRGLLKDLDLLDVAALQWRMCVEAACHEGRQLAAGRYMECRLEQMSADMLGSILEFCQLDASRQVWQAFESEYAADRASNRKSKASEQQIEKIRGWIDPTLKWLDYS